jgi:AMP phosphorylase
MLLEMVDIRNGKQRAQDIIKSGKAEKKLREIVEAQGGDPKVMPEEIKVGDKKAPIAADQDGEVFSISNEEIARIAKEAGAPKEKGAGVLLKAKLGKHIRKGETVFEVYAERSTKLEAAVDLACKLKPFGLGGKPEERMIIERIPTTIERRKAFMLER